MESRTIVIVESDPTLKPIWQMIFERLDYHIHFEWFSSTPDLRKFSNADLVISDSDFAKAHPELWKQQGEWLRLRTVLVSPKPSRHIPFHLNRPLEISVCVELLNWILRHQFPASAMNSRKAFFSSGERT